MKIVRIEIDEHDVTFYFDEDPTQPFVAREFKHGSHTRDSLETIERAIDEAWID